MAGIIGPRRPLFLALGVLALITAVIQIYTWRSDVLAHLSTLSHSSKGGKPNSRPKWSSHEFEIPEYGVVVSEANRHRYETLEVWRTDSMFADTWEPSWRPQIPGIESLDGAGSYIKIPIVADFADGGDKIFVMIKEGASDVWDRLPVHLWTTLTRVKHFGLYSDAPGSVAGHEIVDILYRTSQSDRAQKSTEFDLYRKQREVHDLREMVDYKEVNARSASWELDKFKNLPMLEHAYKIAPPEVEWFVFMDGNTYVLFDNLVNILKTLDPTQYHYFGKDAGGYAHGGAGVVLSRAVMDATFGTNKTLVESFLDTTFASCCGDYMVGHMLGQVLGTHVRPVDGFQTDTYWDVEMKENLWCQPLVTFYKINPHEIEVVWEYERVKRLQGRNITYSELYKDFYLPFMTGEKKSWDNRAQHTTISEKQDEDNDVKPSDKGGEQVRPYENVEACRRYCESDKECLSFRLRQEPRECQTAPYFRFGHATHEWIKGTEGSPDMISGWMVDRIRDVRARSRCDDDYEFVDGRDRVEGWYYRVTSSNL